MVDTQEQLETHLREIKSLNEECNRLRFENTNMTLRIERMLHQHAETYELNAVLQARLLAHGLSPCVVPTVEEKAEQERLAQATEAAKRKPAPLSANMLEVLREVVTGEACDHGKQISPRERAGRGRTLDKLKERGLLDATYQPTDEARELVSP